MDKIGLTFIFLFAISAAGVVGGPQKSPRTSSIVQIIVYFLSFEIIGSVLKILKFYFSISNVLCNLL